MDRDFLFFQGSLMASNGQNPFDSDPTGYRSWPDRRRYVLLLTLALLAFLGARWAVRAAISQSLSAQMAATPMVVWPTATRWKGDVWAFGYPSRLDDFARDAYLYKLTPDGFEARMRSGDELAWLVPDGDRLCMLSDDGLAAFDGENLTTLQTDPPPGSYSRPFRLNNRITMFAQDGATITAWQLTETTWAKLGAFAIRDAEKKDSPDDKGEADKDNADATDMSVEIQGVVIDGMPHIFLKRANGIYHHEGLSIDSTFPKGWTLVEEEAEASALTSHWLALDSGGRPTLAITRIPTQAEAADGAPCAIRILQQRDGAWGQTSELPLVIPVASMGLLPAMENAPQSIVSQMHLVRWFMRDDPLADGILTPAPPRMLTPNPGRHIGLLMFLHLDNLGLGAMLPLMAIMVFYMGRLMARHRTNTHRFDNRRATFAPITRRMAAALIDAILVAWPFIIFLWFTFMLLPSMVDGGSAKAIEPFQMLAGVGFFGLIYAPSVMVALAWAESRWGKTPGKWLMQLRVATTELDRCTFGRALMRRMLLLVDGFFFWSMIGVVLISITEKQQRLGDISGRTIVIDDRMPIEQIEDRDVTAVV
jgi:uncharacterized RDD family membrane protein YckC